MRVLALLLPLLLVSGAAGQASKSDAPSAQAKSCVIVIGIPTSLQSEFSLIPAGIKNPGHVIPASRIHWLADPSNDTC